MGIISLKSKHFRQVSTWPSTTEEKLLLPTKRMNTLGLFVTFGLVFLATGTRAEVCSGDRDDTVKAIKNDNLEDFKHLIQGNGDCVIQKTLGSKRFPRVTETPVLVAAVRADSKDIVTYLLNDLKADANLQKVTKRFGRTRYGATPLLEAVQYGRSVDMVKQLVEEGNADVTKTNGYGESPFMRAVGGMFEAYDADDMNNYANVIDYLLENGADVNETDRAGYTTLMYAASVDGLNEEFAKPYFALATLLMDNEADTKVEVNERGEVKTACDFAGENEKMRGILKCD